MRRPASWRGGPAHPTRARRAAGFTANELWDLHRQGAPLLKLFHAGLASPAILQSMLGVAPLAAMRIMPSGGVGPANAAAWLDAGAAVVGMGGHLVGADVAHPPGAAGPGLGGRAQL